MFHAVPIIAAAIGDPAGIGPEVCVKAVASGKLEGVCHPLLIGDLGAVQRAAAVSAVNLPVERIDAPDRAAAPMTAIRVLDPGGFDVAACPFGKASAASGRAVLEWIRIGTELGTTGRIQGLVMGPVDSGSLKLARGVANIDALQPPGTFMLRIAGPLRVVPLTEHVRLSQALETATPDAVLKVIRVLHEHLGRWGLPRARIAVAGLNPHAMFEEDRQRIGPAIEEARRLGIDASGPISPDSVFRMALESRYDAVVTMYHDQGQIAVKTACFEGACTVYLGLPYVLLNVPHGSAFDIAGRGVAQHLSMLAAMKTAALLASGSALGLQNGASAAAIEPEGKT